MRDFASAYWQARLAVEEARLGDIESARADAARALSAIAVARMRDDWAWSHDEGDLYWILFRAARAEKILPSVEIAADESAIGMARMARRAIVEGEIACARSTLSNEVIALIRATARARL
jgi:hypothetical protein